MPLLGNRLSLSENLPRAVEVLNEALQLITKSGSKKEEYEVSRQLAIIHSVLRRDRQALDLYDNCLHIAQSIGDMELEVSVLPDYGVVLQRDNQVTRAEETLQLCIKLAREMGDSLTEASAISKLARLYLKHKKNARKEAYDHILSALQIANEQNDLRLLAEVYALMGDYHRYEKNIDLAHDYYSKSKDFFRSLHMSAQEAVVSGQIAFLERDQGNYQQALERSRETGILNERIGSTVGRQIHKVLSAELLIALGRLDESYEFIQEAYKICQDVRQKQPVGLAATDRALARYYLAKNDLQNAKEYADSSISRFVSENAFQYAQETWELASSIYTEWAKHQTTEEIFDAFSRVIFDESDVYQTERAALLANVLLQRSDMVSFPSKLIDLHDGLVLLDIDAKRWSPDLLQFCFEHWYSLSDDMYNRVILLATSLDDREELYKCWVESAIARKSEDSYLQIIRRITEGEPQWSFSEKYDLLEPLEPGISGKTDLKASLVTFYVNELVSEIGRAIRTQQPIPYSADDVRRGLYYLDKAQFEYIESQIFESLAQARQSGLVTKDYQLIPTPPTLNLEDKRVALIGGNSNVRQQVIDEARDNWKLIHLVDVPPSWERTVTEKIMREAINGADLILVAYRQMGHDSSYSLKAAISSVEQKQRVRYPAGSGKSSILRAIREYFQEQQG